jgi:hypothetical protein
MIELLHFRILTYIQVSMLMLLCYEYCILFAQEVAYVWNSKWTIIKVLYLFSRYSPFIDTIIAVEEKLNASTGPQSCSHMLQFNTIFAGVGIGISDLILIIRTYAVYQRSRKILILLVILWSVIGIANIASAVYWIDSFSQTPISPVSGVSSCALVGESRMGLINYISFLAGETVICLMTMWQGYLHRHNFDMKPFHPGSRLAQTFYRDGVFFYLALLPITLGNVLVLIFLPADLQILDTPLRVMHSILCCRLVIHIREVGQRDVGGGEQLSMDSLETLHFRQETGVESGSENSGVVVA